MEQPAVDTVTISAAVMIDNFHIRMYGTSLLNKDTPGTITNGADYNQFAGGNIDNLLVIPRRPRELGVRFEASF